MKKTFCIYCLLIILGLAATKASFGIAKKQFNFIIGVNGNFKAAMSAAANAATSGARFYIFFPDGEYDIGTLTGNSNQMTTFSISNVSFIGQSSDKTVIFNKSINESISETSTLYFSKADNLYLQDLSILNKANWNQPSTYSQTGRHVAVMEQGNKIIYKNVKLLSTQDTYYTKGTRTYWENGEIHGTTDFICGGGDIFFSEVLLFINKVSYITAPATSSNWGYVFMNCTIDGTVSSYQLGRAWNGSPKCVYINTTMIKQPTSAAWGDPMNVVPSLFAEYNSKTASGTSVDLSGRRTTYTKNGTTVKLNPVLNDSQVASYTVDNVLSGSDNWKPNTLTKQVSAPVVTIDGSNLKWNDDESTLCWVVFKDDKYFKCVTAPTCEIDSKAKYTVRAANSMGGLGASSNIIDASVTLFNLTASTSDGNGTVTPSNGSFANDQNITITAVPDTGWIFDHWSGDLTGNTNPANIKMTGNKVIYAYFAKDTRIYHTMTLKALIGGSIIQTPEGSKLAENTKVAFTSVPIEGWRFKEWTGDITGADNHYSISSLNSDISATASFIPVDKFIYEAEKGAINEAVLESKNTGFSGDGYVNFSNITGSSIKIPIYVDKAGQIKIYISYSNGSGANRSLSVSVNDTIKIASVDFESASDWTIWRSKQINVTLSQGASVITFETINNTDGPNIDKLEIDKQSSVAVQNSTAFKLSTFFNPARKILCIQTAGSKILKINIFSLNGKIVLLEKTNFHSAKTGIIEIPLRGLTDGIYLIRSEFDGFVKSDYLNLQ